MRSKLVCRAALAALCIVMAASARAEVLAKSGGETVTREEFDQKLGVEEARLKRQFSREEREGLLRSLANQRLLVAEARKRGLHKDKTLRAALDEEERQALANMIYQKEVAPAAQISDDEIAKIYTANPRLFEQRQISQILVMVEKGKEAAAVAKAKGLAEQLAKQPGAFAKLAKAQSDDKLSNAKGGELGWLRPGQLLPELARAAFDAKLNSVVGPVQTQYGLHFLIAKKSKQLALKDVRDGLRQELVVNREAQQRQALLDALGKKHGLKVYADKL